MKTTQTALEVFELKNKGSKISEAIISNSVTDNPQQIFIKSDKHLIQVLIILKVPEITSRFG